MGIRCVTDEQLYTLTETSRYVSELANLRADAHLAYVGHSAFAHKGGTHVNALVKSEDSYQHIDPGLVGNRKRVVVSELSVATSKPLLFARRRGEPSQLHTVLFATFVLQRVSERWS